MTNFINYKSQNVLVHNFIDYLNNHKINDGEYSHLSFGYPWGKYLIKDNELDEFLTIYGTVLGKIDLHIAEKPKNISPLIIDIDIKTNNPNRVYNINDIEEIIRTTNRIITKYYNGDNDILKAYVFEKKAPKLNKNNIYKDGIHIMYPYLTINKNARYVILKELSNDFIIINFSNKISCVEPKSLIDTAIVEHVGWMLYGSKKNNGQYYILTNIYDYNLRKNDITQYKSSELVKLLSTRQNINEIKMNIDNIESHNKKINNYKAEKSMVMNKNEYYVKDNQNINKCEVDNLLVKELVNILADSRASDYYKWISLGWALHNIDDGDEMLEIWKSFSKKCIAKYNENHCDSVWYDAKDYGYTVASLHYWAKEDNYDEYNKIIKKFRTIDDVE